MVPSSDAPDPDSPASDSRAQVDEEAGPGFDEAALYGVIHAAVKDALLDVIGTLLLVGIAFVIVLVGGQLLLASGTPLSIVAGVGLVVWGLYLGAATLEVVPPVRAWLH